MLIIYYIYNTCENRTTSLYANFFPELESFRSGAPLTVSFCGRIRSLVCHVFVEFFKHETRENINRLVSMFTLLF